MFIVEVYCLLAALTRESEMNRTFFGPEDAEKAFKEYKWHLSCLSAEGIELRQYFTDAPLEEAVTHLKECFGEDIGGLVCTQGRIFGDPTKAPPHLQKQFEKNRPTWAEGFNLHLTQSA